MYVVGIQKAYNASAYAEDLLFLHPRQKGDYFLYRRRIDKIDAFYGHICSCREALLYDIQNMIGLRNLSYMMDIYVVRECSPLVIKDKDRLTKLLKERATLMGCSFPAEVWPLKKIYFSEYLVGFEISPSFEFLKGADDSLFCLIIDNIHFLPEDYDTFGKITEGCINYYTKQEIEPSKGIRALVNRLDIYGIHFLMLMSCHFFPLFNESLEKRIFYQVNGPNTFIKQNIDIINAYINNYKSAFDLELLQHYISKLGKDSLIKLREGQK
jgi:hypothetical protein